MTPLNTVTTTTTTTNNSATILPVRVTEKDLEEGRYRLEQHGSSDSPPPTSLLSSPPLSSPIKNRDEASAVLPLSEYLNTTESADSLLTLSWKDLRDDAFLQVAAKYTIDEIREEVNLLRAEAPPPPPPPLPPISKRQATQKISSSMTNVAKREHVKREDLKAALHEARMESGCYFLRTTAKTGGKREEEEEGGNVKLADPGTFRVGKFKMVVDRTPARKWEKKRVAVKSLARGDGWETKTWSRTLTG